MTLLTVSERTLRQGVVTAALVGFLGSAAVRRRPYPLYRALRALDPVHASPFGMYVLSRHSDVGAALRHRDLGSDERNLDPGALRIKLLSRAISGDQTEAHDGPFVEMFSRFLISLDPPDHTRLRTLVAKAFTPRRVEALLPRVAEIVDELLEPVAARGEVELISEFAYPFPVRVICELLGVPKEDEALIVAQAPALATGLDPSPMRTPEAIAAANAATAVMTEYLHALIDVRRQRLGGDLLSALITAEEHGDTLSKDELVATVLLLLMAGHETTANLIGNGVLALLRHPDQLARLRDDSDLDRPAIEELLRYDTPVQMVRRITLTPVEVGDLTIPAARLVILCIGAANHDPRAFENPSRLDLGRSPNPHLAFAAGPHFCIGAPLARAEAGVAIPAIVRRFPSLRTETPTPQWRPSFTVRGLTALHLAW